MMLQLDTVTAEGDRIRKFHEMKLLNGTSPLLFLSWTLLQRIDADSPLKGHTAESLRALNAELLVTVMGMDEVFVQTIHARHSYIVSELRWGEQFVDMLQRPAGGPMMVDYAKFHQTLSQGVPPPVL
jgi:inward rectifier potassium channel